MRPGVVGSLPVAAVTAALWAAAVGLVVIGVVVTVLWAVAARGGDGIVTPIAASGVVWLVAHHAPVDTTSATVTLLPLLLLALPLALLQRAGRWAARVTATTDGADAGLIVVAAAATYATVAFIVAQCASLGDATVSPFSALLWSSLVAVVGFGAGVVDGAELWRASVDRLPAALRRSGPVVLSAATALSAVVGVVAVVAIVARWGAESGLLHSVATGPGDTAGVLLVSLAYLPNLLVWTLAYVVGPGFGIGAGESVSAFASGGALLPGLPLLGAVPPDAPAAAPLLLLAPVVSGVLASFRLRRREQLAPGDEIVALVAGSALMGIAVALLCWLSGGSLGGGRLTGLGPVALATGATTFGLVAAGAVLSSLVVRITPTIWVTDDR
jgi:hypothetical protein